MMDQYGFVAELPNEELFLRHCDPEKKHQINLMWYRKATAFDESRRIDVVVSSRHLKGEDISPSDFLFRTHQYDFILVPSPEFLEWTQNCNFYTEISLMKELKSKTERTFSEYRPWGVPVIKTNWSNRIRSWNVVLDIEPPDKPVSKVKYRGTFCFKISVFRSTDPSTFRKVFECVSSDFEIVSKPGVFFRRRKKGKKIGNDYVNKLLEEMKSQKKKRKKKKRKPSTLRRRKRRYDDDDEEEEEDEDEYDDEEGELVVNIEVPECKKKVLMGDVSVTMIAPPPMTAPPRKIMKKKPSQRRSLLRTQDLMTEERIKEEDEEEEEEEEEREIFPSVKTESSGEVLKSRRYMGIFGKQVDDDEDEDDLLNITGKKRKRTNQFYPENGTESGEESKNEFNFLNTVGEVVALPTPILPTPLIMGGSKGYSLFSLSQNSGRFSLSQPANKKRKVDSQSKSPVISQQMASPLSPFNSLNLGTNKGLLSLSFDGGSIFNSQNQRAWDEVILTPMVRNDRIRNAMSQGMQSQENM